MSKWYKVPMKLDYQDDWNQGMANTFIRYKKQSEPGKRSSIRRNLFPEKYPTVYYKTKNALSISITKVGNAFKNLKDKISSTAQNFHFSSYKRHTLEDCACAPSDFQTPSRKTRIILGRTPTKLYSPFGIETPIIHQ